MANKAFPAATRAIVLRKSAVAKSPTYHDARLEQRPIPPLTNGQVLVKIGAVGFNRRELWQRLGQYPGIAMGTVIGADGAGTVVASADPSDTLLNRRVFICPLRGWDTDPETPEGTLRILGGTDDPGVGTFAEYVVIERSQVIPSPEHLNDVQTASWPVGGVTAWRAVAVNGEVREGHNVLITGIGGGVALLALQICVAKKARVWVSSSSEEKIRKAVDLGASGGVNYKAKTWPSDLAALISAQQGNGALLDVIIDSGGGDILGQAGKFLKHGGRVVCYGMTAAPLVKFTMRDVMRNHKLIGSTMGSRQDLLDGTEFLSKHRIVPVVSHVLDGLESAEKGFELLRQGEQFGKVVIQVDGVPQKAKL
ncbi:hypothetical protein PLICRDRAFT_124628 [Plicaturopsis crispa FD-325 SS-3]|nr:hypothetical protein PLICRDRAFT_124628 [Plicaturopsis crispa FD-325 SS-3]